MPSQNKVHVGERGGRFTVTKNKFGETVKKYVPGQFGPTCKGKCCFG